MYLLFLVCLTGSRHCITEQQDLLELLRLALSSHGNLSREQETFSRTSASGAGMKSNKSTAQASEDCEKVRKMVDSLEEEKASDDQKISKNQGNM
jgi:hypothetical protein